MGAILHTICNVDIFCNLQMTSATAIAMDCVAALPHLVFACGGDLVVVFRRCVQVVVVGSQPSVTELGSLQAP
jgi:hypothetical protein